MDVDSRKRRTGKRSGQVMIMFTLAMIPMFGLVGLVTDLGYMRFIKMSAQTAAEAAAQAAIGSFHSIVGGSNYSCGAGSVVCSATPTTCPTNITSPANALESGCMYAQAHGFNGTNQWVTYQSGVGTPPPTVSGVSSASYWLTFRVVQKVPTMFSAVLGNTSGLVAARSSAAVIGASDCIFALNQHASGALQVGGTANLTSTCGIFVNSDSSTALGSNGGGTISAPEYDVVGGINTHYSLTPSPNGGVAPITDPLASLPVPATGPYTCDYYNYSAANWSNPTLSPGVYCGGINVKNNTYTLNAGTYILVGGGLTTQSTNSAINGTNVLIYNTFGATTNHGTQSYGPISIDANSTVSLKASNSGTYAGILFFEDRNAPASSDTYGGGSSAVYQGTIYAKNAAVTMYGNSAVDALYTILVADTISLVGTTGFNNNYSLLPTGSPLQKVVVLE
jgi:hypothetical protein